MSRTANKPAPEAVKTSPTGADAPLFGEAAALRLVMQSLACVSRGLQTLGEARETSDTRGEPFDDDGTDGELDRALELVAGEVQRMQAEPVDWEDAAWRWYQCDAVVRLACNAYSEGERTYYGRVLHGLARKFAVMPELWDFVNWRGRCWCGQGIRLPKSSYIRPYIAREKKNPATF